MIDATYLENINAEVQNLETEMSRPDVAGDQVKMKKLYAAHKRAKKLQLVASEYLEVAGQLAEAREMLADNDLTDELREMAELEVSELEAKIPEAEKHMQVSLLEPDPLDSRNVVLEIRAGTGGEEAALFAADLFRMYSRFGESKGWTVKILDASEADMGGYKEVIAAVEGDDIFKLLKYESGVHRVQRVPATEASGRIHTSAATVAVLPEADEVDDVPVKPDEIRIDIFRSSGPGGQSVNTTDSAVRITHLATGLIVQCQDEKSQHRNREKAMQVLKARLLDRKRAEDDAKRAGDRKGMIGTGDRSERIRTYNYPQNRITDHRIGLTLYHLDRIVEGDLMQLIEPLYEHDLEERLRVELG
ncbi:MAG: peptide chain release factor 1 [Verrucomicrobia bacterium]|nr:peptide chain release factor 1 [Verrucomicrobiota bacterium]MCH8513596.1 peptide chain release factor 1 [Kiritimatiellia bacterium]